MDDRTGLSGSIAAEQNQTISVSDQDAEELDEAHRETISFYPPPGARPKPQIR